MVAVHPGDPVVEILNRFDYLMKLVNIKNKSVRLSNPGRIRPLTF